MNDRVRTVALGLAVGLVPLLLLDLARILGDAADRDPVATSRWWVVACYLGTGIAAGVGVGLGRRERLVPLIGLAVVLVAALPVLPAAGWVPALPFAPDHPGGEAVAIALIGAYAWAALRGPA